MLWCFFGSIPVGKSSSTSKIGENRTLFSLHNWWKLWKDTLSPFGFADFSMVSFYINKTWAQRERSEMIFPSSMEREFVNNKSTWYSAAWLSPETYLGFFRPRVTYHVYFRGVARKFFKRENLFSISIGWRTRAECACEKSAYFLPKYILLNF